MAVLVIIFCFGLIIGIFTYNYKLEDGYLFDNKNTQFNTNLNSTVFRIDPEVLEIPQNKLLSTNMWKMYKNEIYGYELQYPTEWFISEPHSETPPGIVKNYIDPVYISVTPSADSPNRRDINSRDIPWARVEINIFTKPTTQSIGEWLKTQAENAGPGSDAAIQYISLSEKKFLGTSGFIYIEEQKNAYFGLSNDKILKLSFISEGENDNFSLTYYTMIQSMKLK